MEKVLYNNFARNIEKGIIAIYFYSALALFKNDGLRQCPSPIKDVPKLYFLKKHRSVLKYIIKKNDSLDDDVEGLTKAT